MGLQTGTRLGAYEITVQIGAGGMGEVYVVAFCCVIVTSSASGAFTTSLGFWRRSTC